MKRISWLIGLIFIIVAVGLIVGVRLPILFYPGLPYFVFFRRAFLILSLASILIIYRIYRGPTASDRIVAIDILGILIVGFCACLGIPTGRSWYIDIGIAWALQSFISTLALAKYLEGRDFDE